MCLNRYESNCHFHALAKTKVTLLHISIYDVTTENVFPSISGLHVLREKIFIFCKQQSRNPQPAVINFDNIRIPLSIQQVASCFYKAFTNTIYKSGIEISLEILLPTLPSSQQLTLYVELNYHVIVMACKSTIPWLTWSQSVNRTVNSKNENITDAVTDGKYKVYYIMTSDYFIHLCTRINT